MVAIKDMKEIPKTCCDEDKMCPLFNEETGTCNGVEEFIMTDTTMKRFSNCPLVEIEERKVGKWIRKPIRNDKGGCIGAEIICSCCNKDNRHDEYMGYCPNCGADMRGAENESK